MKKQLAVLLAGSMVLSTLTTGTIFAATSSIGKGLIVSNPSYDTVYVGRTTNITPGDLSTPIGNVTKQDNSSIIRFASDAYIQEGSTLKIELQNARWATDAELTSVNGGTVSTLLDEIHLGGSAFTDAVTEGLELRRLSDTTILVVGTDAITPETATSIAIPADFVPTGTNGEVTATVIETNLPGMSTDPITLSREIANVSGVSASITEGTQVTQTRSSGAAVTLSENVQGAFRPNSTYTITLPNGYYFDNVAPAQLAVINTTATVQAKAGTDWSTTGNIIEYSQPVNNKIEIHFSSDYEPDYAVTSLGSVINISGLVINNNSGKFNNDVLATVYGNGVSETDTIANFATYSLTTEVLGTPTTMNSGTSAQNYVVFGNTATNATSTTKVKDYTITANAEALTNTLKITENIPGSFRGGDVIVTFPEGITVTGLDVVSASSNTLLSGINPADDSIAMDVIANPSGYTTITDTAFSGYEANSGNAYKYITFNDNKVTLRGLNSSNTTNVLDLRLMFELSADNDFEGDVTATVSSSNNIDLAVPIVTEPLATVNDVIDVSTTLKELPVGYSSLEASDITIRENQSNAFRSGETFTLSLDDDYVSSGYGITSANVEVTGGNLEVSDVTVNNVNTVDSSITFTVNGITTGDDLGVITVSDVMVYSDRSVPIYSDDNVVSLVISSTESLQVPITEDYIRFVEEVTDKDENNYNENVLIYLGESTAYVGAEKVDLLGTPYISADGNTMVPVKGIGYALGIEESNVIYDADKKQATFILPNGTIAQIRNDHPYAVVDGVDIPLIDANGNLVSPVIKEGRFYLPLRAACNTVFGVEVSYVADQNAVIVNSNGYEPVMPY